MSSQQNSPLGRLNRAHQFVLRPQFGDRLEAEVGKFICRAKIDAAITTCAQMVRMDRVHQTSELENSPMTAMFTVLNRLEDCCRLRKSPPHPPEVLPYLPDPLVCYLYLTCFDRLGQPDEWLDFGSWLDSSDCKDERDLILAEASTASDLEGSMRIAYRRYSALYGVRSSFCRFLREILSPEMRQELLSSIDRDIVTDSGTRQATDEEKERYLFKLRNDYTHKSGFTPPPGEWFGRGVASPVQEYHANYWTSTRTLNWPDTLEKTVRVGLARYLLAVAKGKRN
jgi:hypothetical protein